MANKGLIGIQLSTIKKTLNEFGIYETMRKCADMGYHCVEISQLPMTQENVDAFRRAKDDFGIKIAAINAVITGRTPDAECLKNDYDKIIADCRALDCDLLRMGSGPAQRFTTREGVLEFCEELKEYIPRLKADGIDYYYHNHAQEFRKFDGEYVLDILRDNSPIDFELDIHWVHAGGRNPVDVINEYAGRIRLLHLKDYRIKPVQIDFRALMGDVKPGEKPARPPLMVNPQYMAVQVAEIGEGNLDIKGCIEAGLAGGSEYFLIEQDTTYDRDPMESLRISRDNLIAMGYGDWF